MQRPFPGLLRALRWVSIGGAVACAASGVLVGLGAYGTRQGSLWRLGLNWGAELVLLGLVGAYGRRLAREAGAQQVEALSHLDALTRANGLLVELHQLSAALPTSLTTVQVVDAALARLIEVAEPDAAAVLLRGPTPATWTVAAATGIPVGPVLAEADLPVPLRHCLDGEVIVRNRRGRSLCLGARSAVYAPLMVGERCLGLVALEWVLPGERLREVRLARTVALQCAVTLDNARLVGGLRSAGADDERHRIAEQLHDDVGQDLAVLALTLDRMWSDLGREPAADARPLIDSQLAARQSVDELRLEARRILGHVRETLGDLRTEVSEEHDLTATLDGFLRRVAARSNTAVSLDASEGRVSLLQEREIWRIAQSAIISAERHSSAAHIEVRWSPGPGPAVLEVRDDGAVLAGGADSSPATGISASLVTMAERAALIGAHLEFEVEPDRGTVLRCRLA